MRMYMIVLSVVVVQRYYIKWYAQKERSRRLNPVTVPAEVVGSSIGRLSHHRMMSGDGCDGLELVRRPYNGRCITRLAVRPPFRPSAWVGSAV